MPTAGKRWWSPDMAMLKDTDAFEPYTKHVVLTISGPEPTVLLALASAVEQLTNTAGVHVVARYADGAAPSALLPAVLGTMPDGAQPVLRCPYCGEEGLTGYYEDLVNRRRVVSLAVLGDSAPYLEVERVYDADHDDGDEPEGDNPRLACEDCGQECAIPEAVDIEFV
jgi:hypothetical protein